MANHPSTDWPATSFLLCGAPPSLAGVLSRVAVPRFLPLCDTLCDTLEEALDQVAAQPPYLRDELALAPTTSWSPTPSSTPGPRCGCCWSCAAT